MMSRFLKLFLLMLFVVAAFGQDVTDSSDDSATTDSGDSNDDSDSIDVTGDSDDSDSIDVTGDSDDSDDEDSDDTSGDSDSISVTGDSDDSDDEDSDDDTSGDSDDTDSDDDSGESDDDTSNDSGDDSDDDSGASDTDSSSSGGSSVATTADTTSYCAQLTSNECGNAYANDGTAICAVNAVSDNCYAVVASQGMYGSGNYDDGYTEAAAEMEQESQKLNAIVGVLAAIVVLLVLALLGGGYYLYQKTQKMSQIAEESAMTMTVDDRDENDGLTHTVYTEE